MAKCPKCGAEVEQGMKFCMECGAAIPQTKECPACHSRWPLTAKFCAECGYNFNAAKTAGTVIGDKNVIAGDVHIDQSSTVNNNTVNNITNTTNNVVNNIINQDDTKKVVQCVVCGKQLPIVDSCVCSCCGGAVCNEHFDSEKQLCSTCVSRQTENNEEEFKRFLINVFEGCKDANDPELLHRIDKQRIALGITIDGVIDSLTYWDDNLDDCMPIVEGVEQWFFNACLRSLRVELSHYLGRCYQKGIGLPDGKYSDIEHAVEVYRNSAKHGNRISAQWLKELNPRKVFVTIKPRCFAEVGCSEISESVAYGMSLEERKRYRAIAQHQKKFMMPVLKDAVVTIEERPVLDGVGESRCLEYPATDFEQCSGDVFEIDDYDYGEDGEKAHLIVAKYHDGCEFFCSAIIAGEFDASKLTLCTEEYAESYNNFCCDQNDVAKMWHRLNDEHGNVSLLRGLSYKGEDFDVHVSGYWEDCEVFLKTSHLFTSSQYDWQYNIFLDRGNLRKIEIEVFGPGIDVRGLKSATSRLKAMTKYDFSSWDDTWNSFTSTKLLYDSAQMRVTDAYSGEVLFEGVLVGNVSMVESKYEHEFANEFLALSSVQGYGVTVLFDRMFTYHRTLTCCYDAAFNPMAVEVPWFNFTFFGESRPCRILGDIEDFKLNGVVFGHKDKDAASGEPMDIIDVKTWLQYKDRQETWNVLTLEDALALQAKSRE